MEHWYEMEGFAADPHTLEIFEREDARVRDLAEAHPKDPMIQIVASAYLASKAQAEIHAQYIQSILRIQGKGKL